MSCLLFRAVFSAVLIFGAVSFGQRVEIRDAEPVLLPGIADSNSPVLWVDGRMQVYTSAGNQMVSSAQSLFGPFTVAEADLRTGPNPIWIESIWRDDDGTVLAWYHHEVLGVCPGSMLTTPVIGALISGDGGRSFRDLGIVIDSADPVNCAAENGYFANGHGDFSVVLDQGGDYFYFFFGAYSGDSGSQGVAAARMAYADRYSPAGAVKKYYRGSWDEPALGGRVTPVFTASSGWERADTDSFWGPSVHWNTHLKTWVMLLNRACCEPAWPQEGIYVTFNRELSDPAGWKTPEKLMDRGGWYPQVIGLGLGETDSLAGQSVRLFVHGRSHWELIFHAEPEGANQDKPSAEGRFRGTAFPNNPEP